MIGERLESPVFIMISVCSSYNALSSPGQCETTFPKSEPNSRDILLQLKRNLEYPWDQNNDT